MTDRCNKIKNIYARYQVIIFSIPAFIIPLIIYVLTLQRKLVGGDTTWYALQLPAMHVMVPTGYPTFSIIGKLFSMIPAGELACRLNLMSAIFGALTILFLFLAINRLAKNVIISFACALAFAFLFDYWTVANRLEFDTLNSFFMALIFYSIMLYTDAPERKNLYFFAAALGLSLTNHPLAFFVLPSFVLYMILVKPGMFKNVKAVLLGILFFLAPLALYAWLPVRSLQGYGPVTTLRSFIFYVTGRNVTGQVHGSSFNHWNIESFSNAGTQFIKIIHENMGTALLIIAFVGLVYLFRKNWKLAVSSVFLIALNFTITTLYLGWTPRNYMINVMMAASIYLSMGFLLLYDIVSLLFERTRRKKIPGFIDEPLNRQRLKKLNLFNCIVVIVLLISFMVPSCWLAASNYWKADSSKPLEIYTFWNEIFDYMEDGSVIYVFSSSSNIGEFINIYERPGKKITFITHKDDRYNAENIKKDIAEGKKIYFLGIDDRLGSVANVKKISSYSWERMNEYIVFYDYAGEKKDLDIVYELTKEDFSFGKKFEVEYRIINKNDVDLEITSIELSLTGNLNFIGVGQNGAINIEPSISRGKYMWVKTLPVAANGELNIILLLQASSPGKAEIDFKITSQDRYFEAEKLELDVSN